MIVFCAGMYRSGSTWQFQVATEICLRKGLTRQKVAPGKEYLENEQKVQAIQPIDGNVQVYKLHHASPHAAKLIDGGHAKCLYSYRDLRDVAFSLGHRIKVPFDVIIEEHIPQIIVNHDFWTSMSNLFVQKYEDWVRDSVPYVRRIASHLGVLLTDTEASEIAGQYSVQENRKRIPWHLRKADSGGWRTEATPEQVMQLARACGDWLVDKGYETERWWSEMARLEREIRKAKHGLAQAQDELARLRWQNACLNWELAVRQQRIESSPLFWPYRVGRGAKRIAKRCLGLLRQQITRLHQTRELTPVEG